MYQEPRQTVCLAMIVRDEAAVIERCLMAVMPFIDSWVIHDMGSQDDTMTRLKNCLHSLPGKLSQHTLSSFSQARNDLLESARDNAELILMLDADEVFESLEEHIELPTDIDIGLININQPGHTIRRPRLFRSSTLPRFQLPVYEQMIAEQQRIAPLATFSLMHHCDGLRHRQVNEPIAKRFCIESIINQLANNPNTCFALAQLELRNGSLEQALQHLETIIAAGNNSAYCWQANYLAASIHLRKGKSDAAIAHYQQCFEVDPDRAEPLLRLAEIHHQHDDLKTARQLLEIITEMPISALADYFEPDLYRHDAALLLAEVTLQLQDTQAANKLLEPLKKLPNLEHKTQQRVEQLVKQTEKTDAVTQPQPVLNPTAIAETIVTPTLTIGMATHDDFDGVYFSIVSLVLFHRDILDDIEFLVIDNNPDSVHGDAVRSLCARIEQARYVAAGEYKGTAVRERIFAEARGEFVICMDCHVFLHAGSIARLLDYFKQNPNCKDLLHGPLYYDNHERFSTHMEPIWNEGFYGTWGSDQRGSDIDGEAFEIPLQGMGLFACKRENWLGFNLRFRGFGGEEGYIHEKFRQHGGRILCLPFLRWTHRFDRPNGAKYVNRWEDRIRNYLIGWHELGLDRKSILEHFSEHHGHSLAASVNSNFLRELNSPLIQYDTIYCVVDSDEQWQALQPLFCSLAIDHIVQKINSVEDVSRLLKVAKDRALDKVLLVDQRSGTADSLQDSVRQLAARQDKEQADILLVCNHDTELAVIQQQGLLAASQSYQSWQNISTEQINNIDHSLTVAQLVVER